MKATAMIGSQAPARPDGGLRILQVTATSVGGAWFYDQVTGLTRLGHSVLAVLPGAGPLHDRLRAAGIPVEIISFQGKRLGQLPRVTVAELRLLRLVRAFRPDVIHAHLLKAVMSAALRRSATPQRSGCRSCPAPFICTAHCCDGWIARRCRATTW